MFIQKTTTLNQTNTNLVSDNLQSQGQISSIITDITNLVLAVNGNLTFSDNIAGSFLTITTGTANATLAYTHSLGSIPIGYIVTSINSGAVIYTTGTGPSSTSINLASTVANTKVTLFLIPGG